MKERRELLKEIRLSKQDKDKLSQLLAEARDLAFFDLVYFIQGLIEKINGNYELANGFFKKSLENNLEDIDMLLDITESLISIGRYEESVTILLKCIELDKEKKNAYLYKFKIGYAYSQLKKYEEATIFFAKSIEDNPNYFPSYYQICISSIALKKIEICNNYLKIASKTFIGDDKVRQGLASLYNMSGKFYYDKKEFELAIKQLDDAISLDKNPAYYTNKGLCFSKFSQYDKAFNEYNSALSLDPKHGFAFYDRALAYKDLNKSLEAAENLADAIKINKRFFDSALRDGFMSFLNSPKCNNADEFLSFLLSKKS